MLMQSTLRIQDKGRMGSSRASEDMQNESDDEMARLRRILEESEIAQ
jgi:hypothetical protein